MTAHAEQVAALSGKAKQFADTCGEVIAVSMERSAALLLAWISHLNSMALTDHADELLASVGAATRETVACASLGAVRPALFSLRAQIDLTLAWLYFKDHPREFATVCSTGNNFILKEKILEYLRLNYTGFGTRFGKLLEVRARREADPYRLLSAHIHAQSNLVLPVVTNLADIIRDHDVVLECSAIQFDVSEYLSDILFSLGLVDYRVLPAGIVDQISGRATSSAQRAVIFTFE